MKLQNIRHWDLALIGIAKLPKWLKKTNSNILMIWRSWHNHTFDNWRLYINKNSETLEWSDFTFWYFVAKNTTLYHEDHWAKIKWSKEREVKIQDWIYELKKQKEFTPEWLKVVID